MPKQTKTAAGEGVATEIDATLSFEQAYTELESIVEQLEQGELPLEQSLALHTRGQLLAAHCARKLELAELRVRTLTDKLSDPEA